MTLPSSGTITLLQVYTEAQLQPTSAWYNKGANIGGYQGLQWWQDNTVTGFFSSSTLSMSDFYSKRSFSPVTAGAYRFYPSAGNYPSPGAPAGATIFAVSQSSSFVVPVYNIMTITIYGGAGGGGGGQGGGGYEQPGSAGVASTFGSSTWYVAGNPGAAGGTGRQNGADGLDLSSFPLGGSGGNGGNDAYAPGGKGGNGGRSSIIVANPISGGGSGYPTGPSVGSTVSFFIGNGGAGGRGANSFITLPGGYNGSPGQWGWIDISWS